MSTINIHSAIGSHPELERLNLFPGRYLGETEFDKRQRYTDKRLSQLGKPVLPGIQQGLEIVSQISEKNWVSISPGHAVNYTGEIIGLTHRVRQSWDALILQYQQEQDIEEAQGIYYLSLRRNQGIIDGSDINDACRRKAIDPHRDIQNIVKGELFLQRLSIASSLAEAPNGNNIANHICASQVDTDSFSFMEYGMPLALVAIVKIDDQYELKWIKPEAGRYLASSHSKEKTLSLQVDSSISQVIKSIHEDNKMEQFADEFESRLEINYLPSIGQLPLALLEKPASFVTVDDNNQVIDGPDIRFIPSGNNVDMIPVPESSLSGIIEREQSRGTIDLSETNQSIRLLLVVNDRDYKADLLDFPQPDQSIENALYQYAQRAHNQWLKWKKQFYSLYYVLDKNDLSKENFAAIQLPETIHWPQEAKDFFAELIALEKKERSTQNINELPLPYRDGIPMAPESYSDWLKNDRVPLAPRPKKNGLVVEAILNEEQIESTQNSLRSKGILLEKIHDLLVLQRQQLDINTVSMATLAGGVASDGSGMQIARWWPHMDFEDKVITDTVPPTDPVPADSNNTNNDTSDNAAANTNTSPLNFIATATYTPLLPAIVSPKKTTQSNNFLSYNYIQPSILKGLDIKSTPLYEYSAKFDQLNAVSNQQKSKVSEPKFTTPKTKFGTLGHLQPEVDEYKIAKQGLEELYDAYEDIYGSDELAALKEKIKSSKDDALPVDSSFEISTDDKSNQGKMNQALFKISRLLLRFITVVESKNDTLENDILKLRKQLKKLYGIKGLLHKKISSETNQLKKFNEIRLEYLADYNMAQQLLKEEWLKVEQQHDHRTQVLESLKALYYVKVRRTPISVTSTEETSLYFKYEGDLLPGCHLSDDLEIPDSLDTFYDAILEVPIKYWQALQGKLHYLPNTHKINQLYKMHQSRIATKVQLTHKKPQAYFSQLIEQNNSILFDLSQQSINVQQTKTQIHKQAQSVFSLEDIHQLRTGQLRKSATKLKDELSQCILCLLKNLKLISPAIRLQWAQLAEDDQLTLEDTSKWPGLQLADSDDYEPIKITKELVQWWFSQLSLFKPNSSGLHSFKFASFKSRQTTPPSSVHSAHRNMIRAVLIEAAYGDASEIVQGKIQTIPPIFRPGEVFRLNLNREVLPGLKLDLMSPTQARVGQLQVEEEDEQGVIARIININDQQTQINTQFSVIESSVTKLFNIG
ncbi:MAG: hypothetical protein GY694_06980 [Gammaproteobacteria bacterium]|nr:hypothetical protein [Gammaproteobacteria bacterium]